MPPTLEEYEAFIYALPARYPVIQHAVLSFIRLGPLTATVRAELFFAREVVLHVRQTLDFAEGFIQSDSYEVYQGEEKRYWYDSWPHPHLAELAATDPHHKHVPPDWKHHRIPAPDLSFARPNLPFLIEEIAQTLLAGSSSFLPHFSRSPLLRFCRVDDIAMRKPAKLLNKRVMLASGPQKCFQ